MSRSPLATRLSGRLRANAKERVSWLLARLSLGAWFAPMLTGCLVDDPPPYAQPSRTPPRLIYHRATPFLDLVLSAKTPDVIKFTIPVASEDAGEGLRTQLFVDDTLVNYGSLPPGTLDEAPRDIVFNYAVNESTITTGCHVFTIRVGHESNLPDGNSAPRDLDDLAEAYWFAYVNLPAESGPTKECPKQMVGVRP